MNVAAFFQPAAMGFVTGLALLWTAALAFRLPRAPSAGWLLLASFAGLFGAAASIGVIQTENFRGLSHVLAALLALASFTMLIDFARRQIHRNAQPVIKLWHYAPLASIVILAMSLRGAAGVEAVCRFVLAIPAGIAVAVVLARSIRAGSDQRWQLPLTAAAIVFLAIGYAFAAPPLQAFAAVGLLTATWSESRKQSPLASGASAQQKWRWPAAFVAIAIVGSTILAVRQQQHDHAAEVAVVLIESASGGDAAADTLEKIDIDPRQLARDQAAAQRAKQGMILLAVVALIALVWIGASRLPSIRR